jgi:hypothetical protein
VCQLYLFTLDLLEKQSFEGALSDPGLVSTGTGVGD